MHKGIAGAAQLYDKADVMSEDKNNIIITNILQLVIIIMNYNMNIGVKGCQML